MKDLLILGAGTAGTTLANKTAHQLGDDWRITIVDPDPVHYYQPGFLFIPFGIYDAADVIKRRRDFLPERVRLVDGAVDRVEADANTVHLADGTELSYDYLVIATGTTPRPDQTPGLLGDEWRKSIHEFYTYEGSVALAEKLKNWDGGRLVINVMEIPYKCPVAPLEFAFLADSYFTELGVRDRLELVYVTPMPGAFTKPQASSKLGHMLDERKIALEADFYVESVDQERKVLVSYDEREVEFDLLVTVPVNMGADFVARSGLGDELNHVPVDKHNFLAKGHDNVFAIGDAAALPTSKAGSVAHFAVDIWMHNFMSYVEGNGFPESFDGHANCFIESGDGKGLLIDFNYDTEPLPGKYPIPGVGPFSLLEESHLNHIGKLGFKWAYWNLLLKGRPIPVPTLMSMAGKHHKS